MTIFGWDTSHYDGTISLATAKKAASEGIEFATAKIGEGGNYEDPLYGTNLTAFRDAGLQALAAYYVPRTPGASLADQADHCIKLADKNTPWWRDFPGWFWQNDVELWDYDRVTAQTGMSFGEILADKTGKAVLLYASKGMYGNQLAPWKPRPLWNANYGSNPVGAFKSVYPGDNSVGWRAYSGQVPVILQYGSNTTIAGRTTCDANAFRGSIGDLLTLINGEETMTPAEFLALIKDPAVNAELAATPWRYAGRGLPSDPKTTSTLLTLTDIWNNTNTVEATLAVINGKLDALAQAGGGSGLVDVAAVKAVVMESLNSTKLVATESA